MKKTNSKLRQLHFSHGLSMGCDPEFFFTNNDGQIVGSEKVLPKNGLLIDGMDFGTNYGLWDNGEDSKFIVDGVQAELNPAPNICRALLGNEISFCFRKLAKNLKKAGNKVDVNFNPCVEISQAELDSLSEKSKVFGCAPSKNVNFDVKKARIKVNPKKYLKRSAGGHIHLGGDVDEYRGKSSLTTLLKGAKRLVPMLDLVVANTCVLIDRDPSNVERRKNYGRVGEYRKKSYGIEYRTLSNFWLRAYPLMSLVMGLCRQTVHMIQQSTKRNDYIAALKAAVPREDVINAVQNNDFDLAYENFKKIEDILVAAGFDNTYDYPISQYTIDNFHHFVKRIRQYGLDYWFDKNSFQHWCKLPDGHGRGWEAMAGSRGRIGKDRKAHQDGKILNTLKASKLPTIDLNAPSMKKHIKRQAPVVAMED